jgi:diguanylate cyclase (GGDEF)-like protein
MTRAVGHLRGPAILVGLAAAYFLAANLGLRLAFAHASASPVWPPAGIALAALLILGLRAWPGVLIGAFLANLTTGSVATAIGIAAGNTLEALVGAALVQRFASGRHAFERARDVFAFALLAALISTIVSATCGVTVLWLGGFADFAQYGSIWLTWWLGDAAGVLIVTPFIVSWCGRRPLAWNRALALEAFLLLGCLVLVGGVVFGGFFPAQTKDYPLEFLCMPLLVWAALRFGQRAGATALIVLAGIAIRGTLAGFGPFARQTQHESLLLLQAYMAVLSVTTLTLAALVAERREVEAQLRHLAVSDALTGIANYRRLIAALEEQIARAQRFYRTFSVVMIDVDHLKRINDRHGHLVGGRALCRVAAVLRASCRASDTAARFGGDEFALLLPDTDEAAARQVASRVCDLLAHDGEIPRITVSFGVAVCPRDGESATALLGAADRALYGMKARTKFRSRA